jgi:hypothetical protein
MAAHDPGRSQSIEHVRPWRAIHRHPTRNDNDLLAAE